MTSFRIVTFGCKVNQCDSQVLRETLGSWGLTEAGLTGAAPTKTGGENEASVRDVDLVVINTCVVTGTAEAKFRKALRRAKRENPHAVTVVTGCYANKTPSTFERLPGVDLMFRTRDFSALADFLRQRGMAGADATPASRSQSYFAQHTRAFLKIQDGCDCSCTYCIVPTVRPAL